MNHELIIVLIWLAAAISLLVLIQVAILGALFLTLLRLLSKVFAAERKLRDSGIDFYELSTKAHRLLGHLETTMHESAEMGHSLNEGVAEVRSRLTRLERSVDHFIERTGQTIDHLQNALAEPGIQFRAIAAAVRAALRMLSGGSQGSSGERNG